MKSLVNIFFCLIVALISTPISFAAETEQVVEEKPATDLKSGDVVILKGVTVEATNPNAKAQVEEKPQEIKEQAQEVQTKAEPKEEMASPAPVENKLEVTYDKNTADINKKVNEEIREKEKANQKAKEEEKVAPTPKVSESEKPIAKPKEEVSAEVKKLVDEIDKFLKDVPATNQPASQNPQTKAEQSKNQEIKKTVDLVTEVVSSDKLTKAESEKIATNTKAIMEEYNKKIEAAPTEAKKQELRKEAVTKINQSIKETSSEAYAYISENQEKITIDDQKNELLEVEEELEEAEEDQVLDEKTKENSTTKQISLEKSPKLNQQRDPKPTKSITVVIGVVIVLGIAIAALLALKHGKKSST